VLDILVRRVTFGGPSTRLITNTIAVEIMNLTYVTVDVTNTSDVTQTSDNTGTSDVKANPDNNFNPSATSTSDVKHTSDVTSDDVILGLGVKGKEKEPPGFDDSLRDSTLVSVEKRSHVNLASTLLAATFLPVHVIKNNLAGKLLEKKAYLQRHENSSTSKNVCLEKKCVLWLQQLDFLSFPLFIRPMRKIIIPIYTIHKRHYLGTKILISPALPFFFFFFSFFFCPTQFLCQTIFIALMIDEDEDDNSYVTMALHFGVRLTC
jgi:hypothetical protein